MTPQERDAFVEAYGQCVAEVPDDRVAEFVNQYSEGVILGYSSEYTGIMDALLMWNAGIKWQLEQGVSA